MLGFSLPNVAAMLVIILCGGVATAVPTALRCEGITDPSGIDASHPRLGWFLSSNDSNARGVTQNAYEIHAASSLEALNLEKSDLWDSGRVVSDQRLYVTYEGRPLISGQRVFWKVRAWTRTEQPGPWSAVATWTMGILSPQDWKPASWISAPGADVAGHVIGYHALPTPNPAEDKWVQIDLGSSRHIDTVKLFPMDHVGINGFAFPLRFKVQASDDPGFAAVTTLADHTTEDFANPGTAPVEIKAGLSTRFIRVTATRLG